MATDGSPGRRGATKVADLGGVAAGWLTWAVWSLVADLSVRAETVRHCR
ncbi:hypothetical protein ABN028_23795 [Actinopolymorpha sp. B17G11]